MDGLTLTEDFFMFQYLSIFVALIYNNFVNRVMYEEFLKDYW